MHIIEILIRNIESKEKKIIKINEMVKENNSNDFFLKILLHCYFIIK